MAPREKPASCWGAETTGILERSGNMATYDEREPAAGEKPSAWAMGWTTFAALMMITIGFFHAFAGLAGIFEDELLVEGPEYVVQLDTTTWGWIHLLLGILIGAAGFGLFGGAIWARTVGVVLAVISAIAGFAWMPWYPVWGIVIVAMAVSVMWALTAHGRDITKEVY
jgi:hypothetical protein